MRVFRLRKTPRICPCLSWQKFDNKKQRFGEFAPDLVQQDWLYGQWLKPRGLLSGQSLRNRVGLVEKKPLA